jgi:hypothetical protein
MITESPSGEAHEKAIVVGRAASARIVHDQECRDGALLDSNVMILYLSRALRGGEERTDAVRMRTRRILREKDVTELVRPRSFASSGQRLDPGHEDFLGKKAVVKASFVVVERAE